MTLPPQQSKEYQAFYGVGAAIKFPIYVQIAPIIPNGLIVNNQSVVSLQVSPQPQGPFLGVGPGQIATWPWNWGPSVYITQINATPPNPTDFLDVRFLAVPSGIGTPTIVPSSSSSVSITGVISPQAVLIAGNGGSWQITTDPSGALLIENTNTGRTALISATTDIWRFPRGIIALGAAVSVTGSKGGNVALASLMTALASIGLVIDNTT